MNQENYEKYKEFIVMPIDNAGVRYPYFFISRGQTSNITGVAITTDFIR